MANGDCSFRFRNYVIGACAFLRRDQRVQRCQRDGRDHDRLRGRISRPSGRPRRRLWFRRSDAWWYGGGVDHDRPPVRPAG